jgi:hypothetical protein
VPRDGKFLRGHVHRARFARTGAACIDADSADLLLDLE